MSKKRSRGLNSEEKELWDRVAKTATPLRKSAAPTLKADPPKPALKSDPEKYEIPEFQVGQKAETAIHTGKPAPSPSQQFDAQPLRMDKKAFGRMKRGKSAPEARIDLHGMTAAAAQTALTSFLFRAHAEGKRLVLVITGKGRVREDVGPIPTRPGVLRHQLPHWLSTPPLNRLVLQVSEAHIRHGGSGAFYVYLVRGR